jgi:putative transcriptional regulator
MSKGDTSKVVRHSRDNLPPDQTDWARVAAMTDEEVTAAAASDPDAQPLTPEQLARMQRVSRVSEVCTIPARLPVPGRTC